MSKNQDDSKQAAELLFLAREYLVDLVALAIVRAKEALDANAYASSPNSYAADVIGASLLAREQLIIAKTKEHFDHEQHSNPAT